MEDMKVVKAKDSIKSKARQANPEDTSKENDGERGLEQGLSGNGMMITDLSEE